MSYLPGNYGQNLQTFRILLEFDKICKYYDNIREKVKNKQINNITEKLERIAIEWMQAGWTNSFKAFKWFIAEWDNPQKALE